MKVGGFASVNEDPLEIIVGGKENVSILPSALPAQSLASNFT